jgi:ABC-type multidrug transport system fused ATPase/permease subunit
VALALGLTSLACLLNLPGPLLVRWMVDGVVAGGAWSRLPLLAAGLMAVFLAQGALALANAAVIGEVTQNVVRDLRHSLYERLQKLGLAYFDRTPTGSIISRLMDDVGAIQGFVSGQTITILTDLGTTLAVSAVLLATNWRLGVVVLVFVPLYLANFRYFIRRIRATHAQIRAKMDTIFGNLKEKLDGALVIKAHAQEPAEVAGFRAQLDDAHVSRVRESRLNAAFGNLSAAISGIGTAAVFAVGANEVLAGRMTPGGVVSTAALATLLFGPIGRLADLAYVFEQARTSVDRLGEILDLEPDVAEPDQPIPAGRARGHVEFDRLGFGYRPGEPVLWDVRLDIRPGMKVALVGPTGCGKSTLMNLLMRFYDPTWGEIRLDGRPIRRLATADLRRQIGIVLQDPIVFRATVAENIRYGMPDATADQIEAAARAALVHGFATALPEGYETLVGEGGHKLSQGERQRLAIARAFCVDPALVVLDEATSSLDTAAEALIQAALANLLHGRTAFIIAHRLSTIVDADLIVVMEGGLVVQKGTHAQLLNDRNGLYRRLCLKQFGETALEATGRADRRRARAMPPPSKPAPSRAQA